MKPIKFPGHNRVLGEGQPQYSPLPIIALDDPEGTVISCWQLTPDEILRIRKTGRLYIQCWTFNDSLQPILPMVELGDNMELTNPTEYQIYRDFLFRQLMLEGKSSTTVKQTIKLMLGCNKDY